MHMKRICILGAITSLLLALSVDAEGQQRRRRRPRPRPAPTAVPAEPTPTEAEAEGDGEPGGATPEAAPSVTEAPPGADVPVSPAPAPAPEPPPVADPLEGLPDVAPVRAELEALMNELVETRSRIAVLGRQLFETRVRVRVQDRTGDAQILDSLDLRLDGAPVFDASRDLEGIDDGRQVFDGFAAPGPHVLLVSIEQRARADEEYRYTQNDTFRFQVVRGKLTEVTIVLSDRSDIAEEFADDGEGEFDVRTRVRVATRELGDE
jgi:hypothetical protein